VTADENAARQMALREAIARIQNMRDEADAAYTEAEPESSAQDAVYVERETLDRVLDVLQILYHGGTPMQGAQAIASGAE
jgi:hypothetical protein